MNFDDIIKDRRNIRPETIQSIIRGLQGFANRAEQRGWVVVTQKINLYVRAIRAASGDWDGQFAQANTALSYVEEVLIRSQYEGQKWDLRELKEGECLPDGTMVEKCPKCKAMGIIRDELGEMSYCAHVVLVAPAGLKIEKRCTIQKHE